MKRPPPCGWRLLLLAVYALCALAVWLGWLAGDSNLPQAGLESMAPSADALLGTDHLGRDVLSLLIQGTRTAFTIGVLAAFIAIAGGATLGAIGGYAGRRLDSALLWLAGAFTAVPGIVLVLIVAFALGAGVFQTAIAIGIGGWVGTYRLARAEVMRLRNQAFIEAAKLAGCSSWRIVWHHLGPNLMPLCRTQFSLYFVYAIKVEVVVSFLGLGTGALPSWGSIIAHAGTDLPNGVWWPMTAATIALAGLVLALQSDAAVNGDHA